MIKNIFFDLDGTLLNMDLNEFLYAYLKGLENKFNQYHMDGNFISKAIMKTTNIVIKNDGKVTNETKFWEEFTQMTQIKKEDILHILNDFYENDFDLVKKTTSSNEYSNKIIKILREKNYRLFLTTNPLFPPIATRKRVAWSGCDPDDFEYITTFDNSSYAKPNLLYFKEVLEKFNLDINETFMFGNDVNEDMLIEKLGIKCYIRTDSILNPDNKPLNTIYQGDLVSIYEFCLSLPKIK